MAALGRSGLVAIGIIFAVPLLCGADDLAHANAALDAGGAELRAGRYQSAVSSLTAALNDESLTSREAATALYWRGLAQRKLGRQAQAISDLGAGIFLGLPSSDRIAAQVQRGFAFRDLGLAEESERELAYAQKAAPNQTARLIKEGGGSIGEIAARQQVATGGIWDRMNPFGGGSSPAPAPAPAAPAAPAAGDWSTSVSSGNQSAPVPAPSSQPRTATQALETAPEPAPQQSGNRLTRWFGSWGNSYAEPSGSAGSQTASAGGGAYRLQLAASRSEAEARQLWQKVSSANPSLSGKTPEIRKADLGDLGTFYRLQIGPFSDKAQSEKLCDDLKRSGVECFLVVTQ